MKKGRLLYFSEQDCWRIVDDDGNQYKPNPFYTITEIKIDCLYINCTIKHVQERGNLEEGWFVRFWDTSFELNKSIAYDIKYHIDKDLMVPF